MNLEILVNATVVEVAPGKRDNVYELSIDCKGILTSASFWSKTKPEAGTYSVILVNNFNPKSNVGQVVAMHTLEEAVNYNVSVGSVGKEVTERSYDGSTFYTFSVRTYIGGEEKNVYTNTSINRPNIVPYLRKPHTNVATLNKVKYKKSGEKTYRNANALSTSLLGSAPKEGGTASTEEF